MKQSIESLDKAGVKYEIFDRVRVEPNDKRCVVPGAGRGSSASAFADGHHSWADAISFARANDFGACESAAAAQRWRA